MQRLQPRAHQAARASRAGVVRSSAGIGGLFSLLGAALGIYLGIFYVVRGEVQRLFFNSRELLFGRPPPAQAPAGGAARDEGRARTRQY